MHFHKTRVSWLCICLAFQGQYAELAFSPNPRFFCCAPAGWELKFLRFCLVTSHEPDFSELLNLQLVGASVLTLPSYSVVQQHWLTWKKILKFLFGRNHRSFKLYSFREQMFPSYVPKVGIVCGVETWEFLPSYALKSLRWLLEIPRWLFGSIQKESQAGSSYCQVFCSKEESNVLMS